MQQIIYIAVYLLGILGCWYVLSSFIILPNKKYAKVVKAYVGGKKPINKTSTIDTMLEEFSKKFVNLVSLNDIKRSEMAKSLAISHIRKTPEEYMAYIFTVVGFILIFAVLFLFIFRPIGIGLIVLSIITYIYNMSQLTEAKNTAINALESELPRYVAFLKQALNPNANVITVMERYITPNNAFQTEINHALADAKTSSFDAAMARLDQRVNSDRMKMVIRGLVSAYHGDDVKLYFAMLEKDFTTFEINQLKRGVKTIPQKMQIAKFLIFSSIFFTLFMPILMQVIDSFQTIFSVI